MRLALLATTAASALTFAMPAAAQDATWRLNPPTANLQVPANWLTGTVPTGVATFGQSSKTALTILGGPGFFNIDTFRFNAGAPAYSFLTGLNVLAFNGLGIVNNSSFAPTFNVNGELAFFNSSTAANATIIAGVNGLVTFNDNATAGTATITNHNTGVTRFFDTSTAGAAVITNENLGVTRFLNSSTAGTAQITNNAGGFTFFNGASTAGSATITNNSGGTTEFGLSGGPGTASAGNATIINAAGSFGFGSGGFTEFNASTTASNATIITENNAAVAFFDNSTGGQARFITNAGGVFDISQLTASGMTAGSIEGAGTYYLGSMQLTVGGNNLSTEVSGVISDGTCGCFGPAAGIGGSLVKVGTGTLMLSGINTYTGATTVNGGTLEVDGSIATSSLTTVNSGGALAGIGTVGNTDVAAGGIFMPGSGLPGSSMTVAGDLNFAPGAIYAINISPATASFTNVSGAATLAGATVYAIWSPGSYIFKQYTILDAGSVSGTFVSGVVNTNLPSGFSDTLSYDASHAYLNLIMGPATGPGGLTINQQNVDNGLINSFNVNGGIPMVFGGLTPAGLTQLSGEVSASFIPTAFQAGNLFLNLMLNPFFYGQFNSGGGFGAIGYAQGPPKAATSAFASVDRRQASAFDSRYGFWGGAYGGSGSISGNATTGSNDTGSQIYGFAGGLDYRLTPDTLVGFALAGGGTHWGLDQGLGSGRSGMFQAGVYGKTFWGAAYLAGALAYSFHDVTTNRTVTIAGTDVLQAGFRANVFSGRLESGYRYAMPWAGVTPYGAVQVQSVLLPAYGESATSGSNQFALNYASQTVTTTRTELGARFDKKYQLDRDAVLTLFSRAAWAHDFGNTASASAIFQALPASNFIVYGAQPAPDGALVTAGAEYKLAGGWSALAKFDGEFSNTTALYSGSGTIKKVW